VDVVKDNGAKDRTGDFYFWGHSASPLVEGDRVIVQPGGAKDNSVVAYHRDTGKRRWAVGGDPSGYASPIAITAGKSRQVVVPTGQSVLGIDPATGKLLWRYAFGNRFDATCATPVWSEGLLFVSAAYGVGCVALEIVPDGDGWTARARWRNKNLQTLMATSIVQGGHVYGCHGDLGRMYLRCLDLKTGAIKWEEPQKGRCALIAAEGHLIILGERGTLQLAEINPARLVSKGELPDVLTFKAWAMPALAKKRLYVRDQKQLVCLDLEKK
jgi:outer membrane protein assembly factor BamB